MTGTSIGSPAGSDVGSVTAPTEREFRFDDAHFEALRALAREVAGIELNDSKRELVYGRLARRLRALGLDDFDRYCALVGPADAPERVNFVNAITTNVTSFFREGHHFDFLRREGLPRLMERRSTSRRLRVWSAACSTGQEPYSIAMTMAEAVPAAWDWRLLATDIDGDVVARAEAGVYDRHELPDGLPGDAGRRWFHPLDRHDSSRVRVDDEIKQRIYFRMLNLMDPWPMQGPLDIIFCRNVVIYFSAETQRRLAERFADLLAPDGYLFIGHSESLLHSTDLFQSVGRTIYRPSAAR